MGEQADRRRAIEGAYGEHAGDVYRVAFALLHDEEAAADVTQETFARAYRRWAAYDASRPLRPWLQTIAAHLALDTLRRQRVRQSSLPQLTPGAVSDDPARLAVARLDLAEALASLSPRTRAALVLHHVYGYDYRAIAGMLRTSPGNVGALLSRGRAALRVRDRPARARSTEPPTADARNREVDR